MRTKKTKERFSMIRVLKDISTGSFWYLKQSSHGKEYGVCHYKITYVVITLIFINDKVYQNM